MIKKMDVCTPIINRNAFSSEQLDIIDLGIRKGVDVSIYAKPGFNVWKMFQIFVALEYGFDGIKDYVESYDAGQLSQIFRVYKNGYPFGLILDKGLTFIEMYETISKFERSLFDRR